MGKSYGFNYQTGRWSLDCDQCGALRASRIKCPIRYCYPAQLCAGCAKSTGWRTKAKHAECYLKQQEEESERREFLKLNADKWVVTTAWGDWADWVPSGQVGVCAYRGGNPAGRIGEPAYFLVPQSEYAAQGRNNFIIDESKHLKFENDPTELVSKEMVKA